MKKALIITGGEFTSSIPSIEYDYVIACDKGCAYAIKLGIIPDIFIGDFDSISENNPIFSDYSSIPVIKSPIRKDDTDTLLAIKHALSKGYKHITLLCGLGLRLDHTLANIQSMHYVAEHGGICEMISDREYLRTLSPMEGSVDIFPVVSKNISLLSLTDSVEELSINGSDYDCKINICNHFPIGHGNKIIDEKISLSIKKGVLLIVQSSDQ